jgi:hypothetical protein
MVSRFPTLFISRALPALWLSEWRFSSKFSDQQKSLFFIITFSLMKNENRTEE